MIDTIKKRKLLSVTVLAYVVVLIVDRGILLLALENTWMFIREMLEVFPAVIVLAALITVWVPPHVIMQHFGASSGIRGKVMSVLVGSLSAGPIYAAFPVTQSLLRKGASLTNVIIIISAWAVVKVPMLIVEVKFLGIDFAAARYLFTVPAIIVMSMLVSSRLKRGDVIAAGAHDGASDVALEELLAALPGANCGGCGYEGCAAFAVRLRRGDEEPGACVVVDEVAQRELCAILERARVLSA